MELHVECRISLIMNEVCVGCGAAACGGLELEAPVTAAGNFGGFASATHCLAGDASGDDDGDSGSWPLRGDCCSGEQLGDLECSCLFCSESMAVVGFTPRRALYSW